MRAPLDCDSRARLLARESSITRVPNVGLSVAGFSQFAERLNFATPDDAPLFLAGPGRLSFRLRLGPRDVCVTRSQPALSYGRVEHWVRAFRATNESASVRVPAIE
jgi:hypothetical protein